MLEHTVEWMAVFIMFFLRFWFPLQWTVALKQYHYPAWVQGYNQHSLPVVVYLCSSHALCLCLCGVVVYISRNMHSQQMHKNNEKNVRNNCTLKNIGLVFQHFNHPNSPPIKKKCLLHLELKYLKSSVWINWVFWGYLSIWYSEYLTSLWPLCIPIHVESWDHG